MNPADARPGFRRVSGLSKDLKLIIREQKRLSRQLERFGGGFEGALAIKMERNLKRGYEFAVRDGLIAGMPQAGRGFSRDEMRILALLSGSKYKKFPLVARYDGRTLAEILNAEPSGFFPHALSKPGLPTDHIAAATGTFVSASEKNIEIFRERWAPGLLAGRQKRNIYFAKDVWGFNSPPFVLNEREILTDGISSDQIVRYFKNVQIEEGNSARMLIEIPLEGN